MGEKFQWFNFPYFGGGYNSAQPPTQIADDEVASILNFEFDLSDNLKARNGFIKYNVSPDFGSRLTSIFFWTTAVGVNHLMVTTGSDVLTDPIPGDNVFVSIKGALTLPTNTLWQWKAFNNLAIGVNGDGGAVSDIVKWTGAGNLADLALTGIAGAPTGAKHIEVFNSRLWVVFTSHPNRVYFSSLGNPEDWSTTGGFIEIDFNDGDKITGIRAFNKRLFIFKRNKISQLVTGVGGKINTDATGWSVESFTDQGGCLSAWTIQPALNDLLFLGDEGVTSLAGIQQFGDFRLAVVSRKVKELALVNNNIESFASAIFSPKSLYLLSVPKTSSGTVNNRIYVFDYKNIREEGKPRWTIFESSVINPSALAVGLISGKKTLFLGGDTPLFFLMRWDDGTIYSDNNQAVTRFFISKAHQFGQPIQRKEFNRVALNVGFSKDTLTSTLEVRVNQDINTKQSYNIDIPNAGSISLWDVAIWNVDKFAISSLNARVIDEKISNINRGISIDVKFINAQIDQDVLVNDLAFEVGLLTQEES